jgi:glycine oxidase
VQRPPDPPGPAESTGPADVVVVGAGVIGLAVSWRLAAAGMRVELVDPEPGRGSSWAAAGMLAPVTEVHYGEEALLGLNLASAARWPAFAAELEEAAGCRVGYRRSGTVLVAAEEGDRALAADLHTFMIGLGLEAEQLTVRAARDLEPALSPAIAGALWAPGDHQVDNRLLLGALAEAGRRAGVRLHRASVSSVVTAAGRVEGVRFDDGGGVAAPVVVLSAGVGTGAVAGLADGILPPVRPVKGQILRMAVGPEVPALSHVVRGVVHGASVYVVPRADGSVVIGATAEERGFDTTVTAGALYELLRDAHRVVPSVTEYVLTEAMAGLRPGSPDNAPVVGTPPQGPIGLVVATGHYRNGVLLAPVTADAVLGLVADGALPPVVAPFAPRRFHLRGA